MVGAWLLMGNQAFRLDSPTFQCEVGEGKFYSVNEWEPKMPNKTQNFMEHAISHKEYTLVLPILHLPVFTQLAGLIAAGTQIAQKTSLQSAHADS